MNILITSSYRPDSETGTSQVTQELCRYLSKKHKILYLCLGKKYEKEKISSNLTYLKIPSIDLGKFALPLITPGLIVDLNKDFNRFKPNIIHAQNSIFTSKLTQGWANENNIPFVVTFHHIPTEAVNHLLPKLSKNILAKVVQEFYTQSSLKSFLKKTDGVIALNSKIEKSVKEVDKSIKIKQINNGLNLKKIYNLKPSSTKSKYIRFFTLGSYTERKNQEYLVKVFSKLPSNYVLDCFGNKKTGREYYLKLKLLKSTLGVKNVNLNDYLENGDLLKKIKNHQFFVSASLKEAQSLAVIQSLALGKPIIVLENETTKEFKNKNVGLILPQKTTPTTFSKELINFVVIPNYEKISKNCKRESKKFNIEKTTKQIEKYYKEIISGSSRTSRFHDH